MKIKIKEKVRERNHLVKLALFRKAGEHRKTNKARRKQENQKKIDLFKAFI